jgi:SHS2 domain-containing protein
MKKFEFLDITTADTAFAAYGKDLNELFANAALAMFEVMINTKKVKPEIKKEVEVEARDLRGLLFGWLNKLLVFYGSDNLAFSKFNVKIDEKKIKLKAECFGEIIDLNKHEVKTEVKACTYHKMEIKKVKGRWKVQVIVDI